MYKYSFPAIFSEEENGVYSVTFPDIKGCCTDGKTVTEAIEMAEDALSMILCEYENMHKPIPQPSRVRDIEPANENEFVSLIACDTLRYRKLTENRSVKKTLTIPAWLNTISERANVNYSAVLQEALIQRLGL